MRTNMGFLDQAMRVLAGAGLLALLVVGPVPGWGLAGLVGVVLLVTGVVGYCPGYVPLGIDTRHGFVRKGVGR
jgi:hypothetical protein